MSGLLHILYACHTHFLVFQKPSAGWTSSPCSEKMYVVNGLPSCGIGWLQSWWKERLKCGVFAWECKARLVYICRHYTALSGIEDDIDNSFICRRWDFMVLWTVTLWGSGRNSLPGENLTGSVQTCCRKDVWEDSCYLGTGTCSVVWGVLQPL